MPRVHMCIACSGMPSGMRQHGSASLCTPHTQRLAQQRNKQQPLSPQEPGGAGGRQRGGRTGRHAALEAQGAPPGGPAAADGRTGGVPGPRPAATAGGFGGGPAWRCLGAVVFEGRAVPALMSLGCTHTVTRSWPPGILCIHVRSKLRCCRMPRCTTGCWAARGRRSSTASCEGAAGRNTTTLSVFSAASRCHDRHYRLIPDNDWLPPMGPCCPAFATAACSLPCNFAKLVEQVGCA